MNEITKQLIAERKATLAKQTETLRTNSTVAIDRALRTESMEKLNEILDIIQEATGEDICRQFVQSESGHVTGAISLIASKINWPSQKATPQENNSLREEIFDTLEESEYLIDPTIFEEIKEARGNHSFMDKKTGAIQDAKEPQYEEMQILVLEAANMLDLPYVDWKLDARKWNREETKALKKLNFQISEIDQNQRLTNQSAKRRKKAKKEAKKEAKKSTKD